MREYQLIWHGRKAERAISRAAERAVKLACEYVLSESQKEVPLEESTLQRSGHTEVENKTGSVEGTISYDTPYAVVQHERLDFSHDAGRKAKYLEDPLYNNQKRILVIMQREVGKAL